MTEGDGLHLRIADHALDVLKQLDDFLHLHIVELHGDLILNHFAAIEQALVVAVGILDITCEFASLAQAQVTFTTRISCPLATAAALVATTTNLECIPLHSSIQSAAYAA